MMDIVDQILEVVPKLKPFFEEDMENYTDEEGNPYPDINIGTRLSSLNMAFRFYVKETSFQKSDINVILDMLEEFAQIATEEELGHLEVRFFEDLIWWAEDKESPAAEKYGDYFLSCIGPKCRTLCDRNEAFWKELNAKLNKEYQESYRLAEEEYAERKKREAEEKSKGG